MRLRNVQHIPKLTMLGGIGATSEFIYLYIELPSNTNMSIRASKFIPSSFTLPRGQGYHWWRWDQHVLEPGLQLSIMGKTLYIVGEDE